MAFVRNTLLKYEDVRLLRSHKCHSQSATDMCLIKKEFSHLFQYYNKDEMKLNADGLEFLLY